MAVNVLIQQAKETPCIFLVAEFDTCYELQQNMVNRFYISDFIYVCKVCQVPKKINNEDSGLGYTQSPNNTVSYAK